VFWSSGGAEPGGLARTAFRGLCATNLCHEPVVAHDCDSTRGRGVDGAAVGLLPGRRAPGVSRVAGPASVRSSAQAPCVSNWTDVAVAAGPSVVAVVAILAAFRQQRRALVHQRELADLSNTRAVFDDAAVALHDASLALSGLERALFTGGATFRSMFPDALPAAETATETLKSIRGRLGVRLPADHVAITAFAKAHDAARKATNAMAAQQPGLGSDITAFPTVQDEHRRLIDATDDFMHAATQTVGARLPA
jgi:hypothetical protein